MTALEARRRRQAAEALLTVDEARASVVRSAVACLQAARCGRDGQLAMLQCATAHPSWGPSDQRAAAQHRRVLDAVCRCEHGWVIDEEIDGVIAATGLDDQELGGSIENLELLAAQVADPAAA